MRDSNSYDMASNIKWLLDRSGLFPISNPYTTAKSCNIDGITTFTDLDTAAGQVYGKIMNVWASMIGGKQGSFAGLDNMGFCGSWGGGATFAWPHLRPRYGEAHTTGEMLLFYLEYPYRLASAFTSWLWNQQASQPVAWDGQLDAQTSALSPSRIDGTAFRAMPSRENNPLPNTVTMGSISCSSDFTFLPGSAWGGFRG
jgi:hypothetical protein